ncbi:MAG: hypothetical protein KIS77_08550 [Saprospiraceae bacterium]|nr:hypothetical protein [Saprospiraceae bacterium]
MRIKVYFGGAVGFTDHVAWRCCVKFFDNYTQIKENLNLPIGKAGIPLIDLYDFQRIASAVRSKTPCQTLYPGLARPSEADGADLR